MVFIEYFLIVFSFLVLISIAIAKFSENVGLPYLILFIGIGMLAGSEGLFGIPFTDPGIAQSIGLVALVFILFSGGLETHWSSVKGVFKEAVALSTLGVLVTALFVGLFLNLVFHFDLLQALLLGAIISCTDAAAVFSTLRSRNLSLKGKINSLLELESGSNDPMAVFLTLGLIQLINIPGTGYLKIILSFFLQMGLGGILGFAFGKIMVVVINNLKLRHDGIYPVFSLAFACFIYGFTALLGGSGFLAVYIAGIVVGNESFVQKKSMVRFFDGLAWLSQICMFLTLGLLVYPSRLLSVFAIGMAVSVFLIFIARPVTVFLSLSFSQFKWNEKAFISWVGLRGAVPIILATFAMIAKIPNADLIFSIVFFIVLTSVLIQGWTLSPVAKFFKVDAPLPKKKNYPIEFAPVEGTNTELVDLFVPRNADIAGKTIVELGLPKDCLIAMINRDENFLVPSGGTVLEEGDIILILINRNNLAQIKEIFSKEKDTHISS
jgi:potassium/hydrogen antiporter